MAQYPINYHLTNCNKTAVTSENYTTGDGNIIFDTFHEDNVLLPKAETVASWQSTGKDYAFKNVSKIDVTSASGANVSISGVLGVMFDRDALGVTNLDKRVTTNYNAKAEFFNNYYKFDAGYFNDTNENFVVFFIA